MNGYSSEQVFNGTFGELWIDGEYMAETKACKAELNITYEPISRVRNLIEARLNFTKSVPMSLRKCLKSSKAERRRALRSSQK